eukprot:11751988-Karenia_brevis.AAC.1
MDRPLRLKRYFDGKGRWNCTDERCIQAIEVGMPVTKSEVSETCIQIVESDKQAKSSIERRLKLNFPSGP